MKLVRVSLMGFALMLITNVSAQTGEQQSKQATSQEGEAKKTSELKKEAKPVETKKFSLEGIQQREAKQQEAVKAETPTQN